MRRFRKLQQAGLFHLMLVLLLQGGSCRENPQPVPEAPAKQSGEAIPDSSQSVQIEIGIAEMQAGEKAYRQYCLVCHQENGSGVPGLNPPLRNTEYVIGDKNRLLGIILEGSNEGLVVNGRSYANAMPSFATLDDQEVAALATFVRNSFGNSAAPVLPEEVRLYRSGNRD